MIRLLVPSLAVAMSLFLVHTTAQGVSEWGVVEELHHYYGVERDLHIYTFESEQEALETVEWITSYTGLSPNFEIAAANVPNASALVRDGIRYILYNQEFMRGVRDSTRTNWSNVSILAHEIGHHLGGHTLQPGGSRPPIELEADRYSGWILQRMGATLDEAQAAMNLISSPRGSDSHPPKDARLAAIANGYYAAEEQERRGEEGDDRIPVPDPPETTPAPDPSPTPDEVVGVVTFFAEPGVRYEVRRDGTIWGVTNTGVTRQVAQVLPSNDSRFAWIYAIPSMNTYFYVDFAGNVISPVYGIVGRAR